MEFAAKAAEAIPELLVATTIVVDEPPNNPLAPLDGAVKVTFTPGTGLLPASFTVTANAVGNALPTGALCGVVPGFAVMLLGDPTVFVREKYTVFSPAAVAVTV
ncbi:MAG TPA: hypothetical protein VGG72_01475 [Bryobacteraceae bacterium]